MDEHGALFRAMTLAARASHPSSMTSLNVLAGNFIDGNRANADQATHRGFMPCSLLR
jgi:hypothetical protein